MATDTGQEIQDTLARAKSWEDLQKERAVQVPPLPEDPFRHNPFEQVVTEAFPDYPRLVQNDIALMLDKQSKLWKEAKQHPNDLPLQVKAEKGNVFSRSIPEIPGVERELRIEEKEVYQKLKNTLLQAPIHNDPFGTGIIGHESRFYLSLRDSVATGHMLLDLTQKLRSLQETGSIPFWQYKINSSDHEGYLRFNQPYRDKGGAPLLYTSDTALPLIENLLKEEYAHYPHAFVPQRAPFKWSPHQKASDVWHVAMSRGNYDTGETIGTPEEDMIKTVSCFLQSIDGTTQPISVGLLRSKDLKGAWENACHRVMRGPKEPWITTDRPKPAFFSS